MAETAHDIAPPTDDGFHEIQLSGKQLVFLFMIAAVVLVATFLCGVQVGRGVRSDRSLDASSTDALSTATPPPTASTPSQPAASSGPPAAEPPPPAQEADDELSYAKRLQGDKPPAEKLKPSAPAAPAPEIKAAQSSAPKAAAPAAPAPKQAAAPVTNSQSGPWVVQLQALKNRADAADLAKRLAAKGYPAFVLDPVAGEPVYYRVQVGGYGDRPAAEQIARRLAKDEHFTPYVRRR